MCRRNRSPKPTDGPASLPLRNKGRMEMSAREKRTTANLWSEWLKLRAFRLFHKLRLRLKRSLRACQGLGTEMCQALGVHPGRGGRILKRFGLATAQKNELMGGDSSPPSARQDTTFLQKISKKDTDPIPTEMREPLKTCDNSCGMKFDRIFPCSGCKYGDREVAVRVNRHAISGEGQDKRYVDPDLVAVREKAANEYEIKDDRGDYSMYPVGAGAGPPVTDRPMCLCPLVKFWCSNYPSDQTLKYAPGTVALLGSKGSFKCKCCYAASLMRPLCTIMDEPCKPGWKDARLKLDDFPRVYHAAIRPHIIEPPAVRRSVVSHPDGEMIDCTNCYNRHRAGRFMPARNPAARYDQFGRELCS